MIIHSRFKRTIDFWAAPRLSPSYTCSCKRTGDRLFYNPERNKQPERILTYKQCNTCCSCVCVRAIFTIEVSQRRVLPCTRLPMVM